MRLSLRCGRPPRAPSRIAAWHARETAAGGMVGDFCAECEQRWPCETRRMADGSHEDLTEEGA